MGSAQESHRVGVHIGIDIGQRRDPTAICVAEVELRPLGDRQETHFVIRFLSRLELGTPYPEVAATLAELAGEVAARVGSWPEAFVDATGVGLPVIDLLRAARPKARISAVFFTHGDKRTVENEEVKLGKAFLVSRLQALLQAKRIHLPRTREAQALEQELLDYEIKVSEDANDRYGAFRVGTHDDLVTALGLAVQVDQAGGGAFAWRARRADSGPGRRARSLRSDWIARLCG